MAKRFTESDKWKDPWFQDLPVEMKLFWVYILDQCDHAGIWKVNWRLAEFQINTSGLESLVKEHINGRLHIFDNGEKMWVKKFIEYQYGTLNDNVKAHYSVIQILKRESLWELYTKGSQTVKDKDKDRDKVKDKDKKFRVPESYRDLQILWREFEEMRRLKKKPLTEEAKQRRWDELEKICGYNQEEMVKVITASIDHGWDKFYPYKENKAPGKLKCPHCGSEKIDKNLMKCDACNGKLYKDPKPPRRETSGETDVRKIIKSSLAENPV